ncbi:MAG: energy transducer TonB [Thermoanaerobaculia bacterium]
MLEAADPSAAYELQSRSVSTERREFRRRHRMSRRAFDRLLVEGAAKDWLRSKYCQVDPDAVYMVCSHALGPVPLAPIEARYTPTACQAKVEGVVILQLVVGPEGVRRVKVLKGLPAGLDEEAVRAAERTTWLPALVCGQPATVAYVITVPYTLLSNCRGKALRQPHFVSRDDPVPGNQHR